MDGKEEEKLGTGLTDVIRLLLDSPTERLLSLTYQLGKTPEEDLVHALSLLFLNKETQGLDRLQLQDNSLANHLAGKWHTAGGKLEDFREQCGHLDNVVAGEGTPLLLARMFKVLSKERMCESHLRDLAYSRAVSAYGEKNNDYKVQLLIEEAKNVCGPQFVEKMSTQMHSPSVGEVDKEITALSLTQGKSDGNLSMPCSLKDSPTSASYPTHLEISLPTTRVLASDQITPVASQPSHSTPPSLAEDESENNAPGSDLSSNSSEASSMHTSESTSDASLCSVATTDDADSPQDDEKPTTTTPSVRFKSPPPTPVKSPSPKFAVPIKTDTAKETEETEEEEEEEEEVDTFYAFVILHAAEDLDMAEAMRERVESICGGRLAGATFSEDFALPGRSSLGCIDDAIENSAFTLLLLTDRFVRNRRFQVEAEAALVNSIERNMLKSNTVIPLLPRSGGMPKAALPLVLKTLVPLEENRSFDRNVKKVLSAARVSAQRSAWSDGQKVKKELRRQERMKEANKHRKLLGDACVATAKLQHESLRALRELTLDVQREWQDIQAMGAASPQPWPLHGWPPQQQQQPQNITITNANYVIIGDDSTMTVDHGDSYTDHVDKDNDN